MYKKYPEKGLIMQINYANKMRKQTVEKNGLPTH